MIITSHVGAGALLGSRLPPGLAFAAGFASHLGMDALPHWGLPAGESWLPVARRDGVVGLGLLAGLTALAPPDRRLAVLAGMTGACLPDTDKIGAHFFGRSPWPAAFDRFHGAIQREARHRLPVEVLTAAALGALAAVAVRR